MANWHLKELTTELQKRGWRLVAEHSGERWNRAAIWEMRRPGDSAPRFIYFDGLDGNGGLLPISKSYGCAAQGGEPSLYFSRRGDPKSPARKRWRSALTSFVKALG
jgi:hypothetical protein